jgi:hypothetical protein
MVLPDIIAIRAISPSVESHVKADGGSLGSIELRFSRVVRHIDQGLMAAGIVETRRKHPLHAERAHIAERSAAICLNSSCSTS